MGKKGSNKNPSTANSGHQVSVTLREASTGKKHTNVKSSLKLEHLKNLAVWTSHDAAIPSLGAFFGHHFAASSEALATPADPSLFICQRCESILHPGNNCTIRIEKYNPNARQKRKKNTNYPQNNIVYTCHFCLHRNMKRGTPRNISPQKVKPHPKSTKRKTITPIEAPPGPTADDSNTIVAPVGSTSDDSNTILAPVGSTADDSNTILAPMGSTADDPSGEMGNFEITETLEVKNDSDAYCPTTPSTRPALTLLELKMGKRNRSKSKKKATSETPNAEKSANTSKRKRRKSWTGLKELAENDNCKRSMNFTIPFSMQ